MSHNKMLIDATHPEETRVVVLRNNRVEEFDYESAARKLLRGNIYLAKVTRVEPSLQAAFVDYGGNRHGFLAFNEIHPDYYQIPMADRQALLDEEAAAEAREEAEADARAERLARRQKQRGGARRPAAEAETDTDEAEEGDETDDTIEEVGAPGDMDDERTSRQTRSEDDESGEEEDGEDGEEEENGEDGENDEPNEPERTIALASAPSGDRLSEEHPTESGTGATEPAEATQSPDAENGGSASAETGAENGDVPAEIGLVEDEGIQVVAPVNGEAEPIEQVGSEDALEELPSRPRRRPRSYKIQEVIKRRQIILVQVVKEERGTKGAALTTYLSLAGRYTVLMPNTARGGGISRKITNPQDRKRLKAIAAELDVPEGMGLIIRTAGAARTKQEIKRDFEYLLRLWESVRDLTLQSTAPSLVYEEGNLIKRSIRDLYDKDVDEVVVAGKKAYEEAHDFMRMLMPSHARNVHAHTDPEPLFTKFGIERQLNAMFSPYVTLRSGGYLVINQTEALVAIDVNSGKATREFSIEETALHTNLEAADEIARQLKLRDLAGLIVIDFIDMEEKRNNRAVERRLKDALRFDRARIQLGRISHFGLMEMSRQRMRTGVLEGSTSQCPHCQGTGIIRSTESVALAVLRGLEDALMQGARTSLVATTTAQVALYILNNKRQFINDMEAHNGVAITVQASDKLQGANFTIERGHAAAQPARRPDRAAVNMDWGFEGDGAAEAEPEAEAEYEAGPSANGRAGRRPEVFDEGSSDDRSGRRRRRRRGRRGGAERPDERPRAGSEPDRAPRRSFDEETRGADRGADPDSDQPDAAYPERRVAGADAGGDETFADHEPSPADDGEGDRNGRRRRRGRRGGRRGRGRDRSTDGPSDAPAVHGAGHVTEEIIDDFGGAVIGDDLGSPPVPEDHDVAVAAEAEPEGRTPERQPLRSPRVPAAAERPEHSDANRDEPEPESEPAPARRRSLASSSEPKLERVVVRADEAVVETTEAGPPRRGWWQRRLGD